MHLCFVHNISEIDKICGLSEGNSIVNTIRMATRRGYCKSLKYSGNNTIAIIALCPYALF